MGRNDDVVDIEALDWHVMVDIGTLPHEPVEFLTGRHLAVVSDTKSIELLRRTYELSRDVAEVRNAGDDEQADDGPHHPSNDQDLAQAYAEQGKRHDHQRHRIPTEVVLRLNDLVQERVPRSTQEVRNQR